MRGIRSSAWKLIGIALAFLLCGVLHAVLYDRLFFDCFVQFYCGIMATLWILSVQRRVTDPRLRRQLVGMALCLLALLTLQIIRYTLVFGDERFRRLSWYGYYVPVMAAATLCLAASLSIHRRQTLPWGFWVAALAGTALTLLMLTNDLHHWCFRFPEDPESGSYAYSNGPVYYIYYGYVILLMTFAFFTVLRRSAEAVKGPRRYLPAVPLLLLLLIFVLSVLGWRPRFGSAPLWNLGESLCFGLVGFMEVCIQIGLIPANTGYDRIFAQMSLPAVVLDQTGKPVARSAGADRLSSEDPDRQVLSKPIRGGSVNWCVDRGDVLALNRQLEESTAQLSQRSELLLAEGRLQKERTKLDVRSRLYDRIRAVLQPQLDELERLSEQSEEDFSGSLPRIALLLAYIKRRSNMELLSEDGSLTLDELASALQETGDALRLCGVELALTVIGSGRHSARPVIAAYEHFFACVFGCLDSLQDMVVTVRVEQGGTLALRLLFRADPVSWDFSAPERGSTGLAPAISVTKDRQDLLAVLRFREEVGG